MQVLEVLIVSCITLLMMNIRLRHYHRIEVRGVFGDTEKKADPKIPALVILRVLLLAYLGRAGCLKSKMR